MFPSSSYMDPYLSQNKEQVPYPSYPFYPYPVPRPEPSAQPASYAPWPYHFNPTNPSGYPYPPAYCGPRPPFPYELPPPNFPNYYHPSFAPMPSYPAKYPQVDPTTHQTHCCGCPNHVCHGTHSPKVKIAEETSDVDQTNMPNNSHPFFWFSPRNKVQQDEIEQSKKERKGAQFPWPIAWIPEDGMKEKEKKNSQFPWPIIWMPEDESKERKDQHANKRASEEAAKPSFRIIPLKFLDNGGKDQAEIQKPPAEKKQGAEEASKDQMELRDKSQAEVKSIPVLEKKGSSEKVGKEQPIKEKDSTGDRVTEKKHSKLPPVCLRVDPLPNKRPTNGSSKEDKNKKEVRVVDVKSAKDERKGIEIEVKKDTKEKLPERKNDDIKRGAESKDLNEREIQSKELKDKSEKGKVKNVKRSQISEQDAALLIQSAYRGYNVRRWDPLKKLKKIRSVHEKAQELLWKLKDVEESSKPLEKKEQLILSESIMNLLLQLDTIQGLHPTVREARKSVAKELVLLQEKLDSLEKQKAVETPTNEVSPPQTEVQPTATNISSEEGKLVSEQVELQASEAPTLECITTLEEDEEAHESLNNVDATGELNLPKSATDFPLVEVPVKNENDASSTTPEEPQLTPLGEETRPNELTQGTISGENCPEALCLPQTENSQNVECMENASSDVTEEAPSVAIESCATDLAPAVASSESATAASHTLSESEVLNAAVISTITEEIHDTEVAPGVAVSDGIDTAAILPETKDLDGVYESNSHPHATESNAEVAAPEVTLSGATTKEVNMLEESHDSDAAASVENAELQATEDGKPSSKEMKVEDNEIASDATVTASAEVELHNAEVPPEEGNVNGGVASTERVGLLATEADKVKDENKSVEENEVTSTPGNEVAVPESEKSEGSHHVLEEDEHEAEAHSDVIQANAMEAPPQVEVINHATDVGKLSTDDKKLVEENEMLRDMLEKLMEAGRNQLDIISGLNERVKGLEKKLEKKSKKSKVKVRKHKPVMASSIEVL